MAALLFLFYLAAKKNDLKIGETKYSVKIDSLGNLSDIPFADDATLNEIGQNKKYVPYKISRKLAVMEMETNLKNSMNWQGMKLSQKPVLIYDGKSRPKYYEFIVQDQQGRSMGTITATAIQLVHIASTHIGKTTLLHSIYNIR
jgi:hypothetical protein